MEESSDLTYSTVYSDTAKLNFEEKINEEISKLSKSGQILSIYSINARAIYFFPVSSKVLRIQISINPLTPEIVSKIMTKISEFAKKVIYSTGLCLMENKCFWEGFFQEDDLSISLSEITFSLEQIPEVKDIVIDEVKKG